MTIAMAETEVGDDQYGEDPTVNRLEKRGAELLDKDAAVYVPSGMMGNLCGVLAQTQRGDEIILGDLAHIYQNEMGAAFVLGGARIFNAAAALGADAKDLVREVDTVQFCFSKGLAAPVGFMVWAAAETV